MRNIDKVGKYREEGDVESLVRVMINHKDSIKRIKAVRAIAELSAKDHIRDIGRIAVTDPSPEVRKNAVEEMVKFEDSECLDYLVRALYDPSKIVRSKAAWSLGEIGSEKSIEHLKRTVKNDYEDVKKIAFEALYKIEGEKFVTENPSLVQEMEMTDQMSSKIGDIEKER